VCRKGGMPNCIRSTAREETDAIYLKVESCFGRGPESSWRSLKLLQCSLLLRRMPPLLNEIFSRHMDLFALTIFFC
jgi:hypothetical protein